MPQRRSNWGLTSLLDRSWNNRELHHPFSHTGLVLFLTFVDRTLFWGNWRPVLSVLWITNVKI